MGVFLTNITLRGAMAPKVAAWFREQERRAFVSVEVGGCIIVCDQECEDQDADILSRLGAEVSKDLQCAALVATVHDSDVLTLKLYEGGRVLMDYNSSPAYFENVDPQPPSGANGVALCRAFGSSRVTEVETLLDRWLDPNEEQDDSPDADELIFEEARLARLASLLGIPEAVALVSYSSLQESDAAELGGGVPIFEKIE